MANADEDAIARLPGRSDTSVVLTCEHASQRLPPPWRWPAKDRRLIGTHWAYDLGASELTRELSQATGAPGVLARFTRLLADANRPEDADTLFRREAEGAPVELNTGVSGADRELRLARYWRPYHEAVNQLVATSRASVLLAVHTFTPLYEGRPRELEIGVLYDREQELAEELADALAQASDRVALNEPYSGRDGLTYAVERHAHNHDRRAVEIEVRQDLAVRPAFRARVVEVLAAALRDCRRA